MSEKLYLKPGRSIGKKGLAGGKLSCKAGNDPLELTVGDLKVLEKNIPGLKVKGVLLDVAAYDKFMTVEDEPEKGKSDARVALEKEATEFGIEFTDRTSQAKLKELIEAKKAETVSNTELEDLKVQATELEIEFSDDVSIEDLKLLVEDGLK